MQTLPGYAFDPILQGWTKKLENGHGTIRITNVSSSSLFPNDPKEYMIFLFYKPRMLQAPIQVSIEGIKEFELGRNLEKLEEFMRLATATADRLGL